MKKIKLLFCILFILTIISPLTAEASCEWRQELTTQNIELGTSQTTGGCNSYEAKRNSTNAENCVGTAPADTNSFASRTHSVCCCSAEQAATVEDKPKYILPDFKWQVPIPGLKLSKVECGEKCEIPWISEYVFGVYNYLLTIVAVIAVVILMAAGLLWIVSGGDAGKIGQAKTLITGSITGLLLLISMSLFLSYINPDLTKSTAVKLDTIKKFEAVENGSDSQTNPAASDCPDASSMTDISSIVSLSAVSDPRLTIAAADGLRKAVDAATKQGVKLMVTSATRTYAKQKELWDAQLAKSGGNEALARKYVANPSNCIGKCSGHCAGIAVDICIKGTASCGKMGGQANASYSDPDVIKLKNIMESVGWKKYVNEWWHFQY